MFNYIISNRGMGALPIIIVIALLAVAGIGYGIYMQQPSDAMEGGDAMMEKDGDNAAGGTMLAGSDEAMMEVDGMVGGDAMMVSYEGMVLAGKSSPFLDFTKADYEAAKKTDKLIVLYFYANWCPICAAELPKLHEAFNGLSGDNVIGFRVNYNDSDTDADEKALAKEFGVAYQHTKVFVKNGERTLKSPESWDTARYNAEISAAVK